MDVGLLDHRRQRLLRRPPGFEEGREVAPPPELGDPELDGARPGLPVPLAIPVPLHQAVRGALPVGGSCYLPTSSSISRWAAKPIISRRKVASADFSSRPRRAIVSSVIVVGPRSGVVGLSNPTLP